MGLGLEPGRPGPGPPLDPEPGWALLSVELMALCESGRLGCPEVRAQHLLTTLRSFFCLSPASGRSHPASPSPPGPQASPVLPISYRLSHTRLAFFPSALPHLLFLSVPCHYLPCHSASFISLGPVPLVCKFFEGRNLASFVYFDVPRFPMPGIL